jgi:predicted outer membrane repeat protein
MLTLNTTGSGGTGDFTINGSNSIQVDLLSLNKTAATYTLVSGNGNFGSKLATNVTLRGEAVSGTRAPGLSVTGGSGASGITLTQSAALLSAVATWNGASGGNWNIAAPIWTTKDSNGGTAATQFLHGDVVNFANTNGTATIAVNPAGDHTVRTAGIYFSGGANYAFEGGILETDAAGTSLTGATGKFVLGAKADNNAVASQVAVASGTGNAANSYSGTVDLTKTGANTFSGGVELYSGTLLISDAAQLGAPLSKVRFLGDPNISMNTPTVRIAAGKVIGFTSVGDASQRLAVEAGKSGAFYAEAGASLVFDYSDTAIVAAGGKLDLKASAPGLENGQFIFRDNRAANGAAVRNAGELTVANTTFTRNEATGKGGAVSNEGAGTATFRDTLFLENKATSSGGAVHNASTGGVTFVNPVFDGNTSRGAGGAISSSAGTVTLQVQTGKESVLAGNRAGVSATGTGGTANSVHLDASTNNVGLTVLTEGTGKLHTVDPITASGSKTAVINKTGTGTWYISGTNALGKATLNIREGVATLNGAAVAAVEILIPGGLRDERTIFDYKASAQGTVGVLNFNAGGVLRVGSPGGMAPAAQLLIAAGDAATGLRIGNGVQLVLGPTGTVQSLAGSARGVTLAPGAKVVFEVLGTATSVGGLTQHGSIATDNLLVSGGTNLVLDLSGADLTNFLIGQPGDLADGTLIRDLFTSVGGTMLVKGEAGLSNLTIKDKGNVYDWVMLTDGSIKAVALHVEPPPLPEPSTYALLGGLGVLGFALWRKRQSRKLKN